MSGSWKFIAFAFANCFCQNSRSHVDTNSCGKIRVIKSFSNWSSLFVGAIAFSVFLCFILFSLKYTLPKKCLLRFSSATCWWLVDYPAILMSLRCPQVDFMLFQVDMLNRHLICLLDILESKPPSRAGGRKASAFRKVERSIHAHSHTLRSHSASRNFITSAISM